MFRNVKQEYFLLKCLVKESHYYSIDIRQYKFLHRKKKVYPTMSIYRNDDILITDLMDRIDKLENQVTDLKKSIINNLEKVTAHFYMVVKYVGLTICILKIR